MTDRDERDRTIKLQFLKDCADMLRGRVLFFMPFFAAFVAFLVSKSDYVVNAAGWSVKLVCMITFLAGVGYAAFISETIWLIDDCDWYCSAKATLKATWLTSSHKPIRRIFKTGHGSQRNVSRWRINYLDG